MSGKQPSRRVPRRWIIAALVVTVVGVLLFMRWGSMLPSIRRELQRHDLLAPDWSTGERLENGQWEPKDDFVRGPDGRVVEPGTFTPERPGPILREVGRWNCPCVQAMAFYPDGKRIAAGATVNLPGADYDGSNRSWCVLSLPDMRDTGRGGCGGRTIDVSSKGDVALSTGRPGRYPPGACSRVEVCGPEGGEPRFFFFMRVSHPGVRFTADGSKLVAADANGMMEVWDVRLGILLDRIHLIPNVVYDATAPFSPNLDVAESGSFAISTHLGEPLLVDLKESSVVESKWWIPALERGAEPLCGAVPRFSHDGTLLGTATEVGDPMVYDRINRKTVWTRNWRIKNDPPMVGDGTHEATFSPDGRLLAAVGDCQGHVALFDAQDGAMYDRHLEFTDRGYGIRWSPDGSQLAACGMGGVVLYDVVRPPGWK